MTYDKSQVASARDYVTNHNDKYEEHREILTNSIYEYNGKPVYAHTDFSLKENGTYSSPEFYVKQTDDPILAATKPTCKNYCPDGYARLDDNIVNEGHLQDAESKKFLSKDDVTSQIDSIRESAKVGEVVLDFDDYKKIKEVQLARLKMDTEVTPENYDKYLQSCESKMKDPDIMKKIGFIGEIKTAEDMSKAYMAAPSTQQAMDEMSKSTDFDFQ